MEKLNKYTGFVPQTPYRSTLETRSLLNALKKALFYKAYYCEQELIYGTEIITVLRCTKYSSIQEILCLYINIGKSQLNQQVHRQSING